MHRCWIELCKACRMECCSRPGPQYHMLNLKQGFRLNKKWHIQVARPGEWSIVVRRSCSPPFQLSGFPCRRRVQFLQLLHCESLWEFLRYRRIVHWRSHGQSCCSRKEAHIWLLRCTLFQLIWIWKDYSNIWYLRRLILCFIINMIESLRFWYTDYSHWRPS